MPKQVKCRRKTVKRCKRAYKSCKYVSTKKSRFCRQSVKSVKPLKTESTTVSM